MSKTITVRTKTQWRKWLEKYHLSEEKVFLVSYKRHTGKKFLTHNEQMLEAICFGWIDTTVKKIDEEKYGRYFVKRKSGATWSKNTLKYGEELYKAGLMSPYGKKMYLEGKKKKPIDHDVPKVLTVPEDLKKALNKNKKANAGFEAYTPSARKVHLKWLFSAKRPETRQKRIKQIIEAAKKGEKVF